MFLIDVAKENALNFPSNNKKMIYLTKFSINAYVIDKKNEISSNKFEEALNLNKKFEAENPKFLVKTHENSSKSSNIQARNIEEIEKVYLELNKERKKVRVQEKKIIKFHELFRKKELQLEEEKMNLEKFKESKRFLSKKFQIYLKLYKNWNKSADGRRKLVGF